MRKSTKTRSLKRILIETVVFSFLLALLLMYNLKEDKNIADSSDTNTELSVNKTNNVSLF